MRVSRAYRPNTVRLVLHGRAVSSWRVANSKGRPCHTRVSARIGGNANPTSPRRLLYTWLCPLVVAGAWYKVGQHHRFSILFDLNLVVDSQSDDFYRPVFCFALSIGFCAFLAPDFELFHPFTSLRSWVSVSLIFATIFLVRLFHSILYVPRIHIRTRWPLGVKPLEKVYIRRHNESERHQHTSDRVSWLSSCLRVTMLA